MYWDGGPGGTAKRARNSRELAGLTYPYRATKNCGAPRRLANRTSRRRDVVPAYFHPCDDAKPIGPIVMELLAEIERLMHSAASARSAAR